MSHATEFWVLQHADGMYYGVRSHGHDEFVVRVTDPLVAVRFTSAEEVKAFHGRSPFYAEAVKAVHVHVEPVLGEVVDVPAIPWQRGRRGVW